MSALEWFGAAHLMMDAAALTLIGLVYFTARQRAAHDMPPHEVAAIRARIRANRVESNMPDSDDEHAANLGAC